MRVDLLVMTMFRVFNVLWESCAHRFKDGQLPYIVTYQVLPLAIDKGVIEAVANAHSVADHKWSAIDKHRTVSSSIGCFIGGYMLVRHAGRLVGCVLSLLTRAARGRACATGTR